MAINEKYSYKSFQNKTFIKLDAKEFNDSEIVGSNFYQDGNPDSDIFPEGMTGVTFIRCNMDNVAVPSGNTQEGGCNRRIKAQNDLETWVIDSNHDPIAPCHKQRYIDLGLSVDPMEIPTEKIAVPITIQKEIDIAKEVK